MARIAGDDRSYKFRLCRTTEETVTGPRGGVKKVKGLEVTEFGIDLPSVTTIVKAVWGSTFTQAAYWGYGIAIEGASQWLIDTDPSEIKEQLKKEGYDPNKVRNKAADRGLKAHGILEDLCAGKEVNLVEADGYSIAADGFYSDVAKGSVVQSERVVFHLPRGYVGTTDLVLDGGPKGLGVVDAKTHGQASKTQAAYEEDRIQIAGYAEALEWMWEIPVKWGGVVLFGEDAQYTYETFELGKYRALWHHTLESYKLLNGKGRIT